MESKAPTIQASAPGKVMLSGEYAVLEGAPSWLIAINRRAVVTFKPSAGQPWQVRCKGGLEATTALSTEELLETADTPSAPTALLACALASQPVMPGAGGAIELDTSAFTSGDVNIGLGSSAALCVALDAALAASEGREPVLARAISAHRRFQGDRGSGADIATSLLGGSVRFEEGDATRIGTPPAPPMLFVWSGVSASTPELVRRFQGARARQSRGLLTRLIRAADAVFNDSSGLLALASYGKALEALDDAWQIGVMSEEHRQIADLCSIASVSYKTCGAGGGDLGIAFSANATDLQQCALSLQQAGFLCLDLEPDHYGVQVRHQR